ncbi:class I adenylate-forming enzyme family protein [Amycolatopsis albispora]|uniref:Fatty acid--CoA ligase n=1 Tax=Amycolatopsis albispora TaxID=1804986 RepID=A0A344LG43_9PSEU|nr:AMP-binding protein [Amycolatopsis albispora]AXB47017.1 fatty acid--CoA ligase [Amycolatopsis albispora]
MDQSFFLTRVLEVFDEYADRVLFRHSTSDLTYAEAGRRLRRLHAAMPPLTGKTVAISAGNHPDAVLAQLAAQLRGARVLLIAASAPPSDRKSALDAADAVLLDPAELDAEPVEITVPARAETVFTSGGTTGAPKLIRHSGTYEGMVHVFHPDPAGPNRILVVAPISHLTGNAAVLGALLCGDTVVLHDGFSPDAVVAALSADRITRFSLTPARLGAVLDHPALAEADLSSLRAVSLGASALPVHRLEQALAVFGPIVGQGYGLTEAPMIATITAAEYAGHPARLASVGRIVPGMRARIGDDGEVLVQGLSLMDGYLDRPLDGDWLRTGDLGHFDEDGYLYLHGRADDVIVTGEHGTKVHPTRVEEALVSHPRVRQSAVVGRSTPDGPVLHAVVVPDGEVTADELRAHVAAELVQPHFVPATVEFRASLPLTHIGKLDRKRLR